MNHWEIMGEMEQRIEKLERALKRLANPLHLPKTEEAALLQIEVETIAKEALREDEPQISNRIKENRPN
jgi:hypothetical protein